MSSFSKYDGESGISQQLLFPLNLFFSSSEMELIGELQLSLMNTGFVFEDTDHIVISGIPVNVTESEVSFLEQLLSDLQDGIPESSFSQNDMIKSMAKSLAVKTGTHLTEKNRRTWSTDFCLQRPQCFHFINPLSSRCVWKI
jgi:DNA mismatch repair protein MutL